jgi:hypothetical protein
MTSIKQSTKQLHMAGVIGAFSMLALIMCDNKKETSKAPIQKSYVENTKLNSIFKESFREYNVGMNNEGVVDTVYAISARELRAAGFNYGQ